MGLRGVKPDCPDFPVMNEDAGGFVGGSAVVGGGEDSEETAILLQLERGGRETVSWWSSGRREGEQSGVNIFPRPPFKNYWREGEEK